MRLCVIFFVVDVMNLIVFPRHVLNLSKPRQCLYHPLENKIPNSESVGFQSLGPGSGDRKMHTPKKRNSPGTLLEPSWNRAGTLLEPCSPGTLLESCWNAAGTPLELEPCWNFCASAVVTVPSCDFRSKDKFWSFVCFFPRASERRVLLIVGVCQTFSHLHIFT